MRAYQDYVVFSLHIASECALYQRGSEINEISTQRTR